VFLAIRDRIKKDDEGFTLIELLVVVIIIGILAAIAIPAFLSQRQRGYQAALVSDVRNAAIEVESTYTSTQAYPANNPNYEDVDGVGSSSADTTIALTSNANGFCLVGSRTDLGVGTAVYDSNNGGIQQFDGTAQTCTLTP
jgi:type IV pilus assembly protein PilA